MLNSVAQYSVVSGLNHSLRISDGKVQAYGDNTCGQLGTGNNEPIKDFVDVTALGEIKLLHRLKQGEILHMR